MLVKEKIQTSEEVRELIKKYGRKSSSLLPILKSLQNSYGYISDFAMHEIERQLNINSIDIYKTISFNKFLKRKAKAKNIVMFCDSCKSSANVNRQILKTIEDIFDVKIGELTKDGKFLFKNTGCLGMCHLGPVLTINDRVYTKMTKEKVLKILTAL